MRARDFHTTVVHVSKYAECVYIFGGAVNNNNIKNDSVAVNNNNNLNKKYAQRVNSLFRYTVSNFFPKSLSLLCTIALGNYIYIYLYIYYLSYILLTLSLSLSLDQLLFL